MIHVRLGLRRFAAAALLASLSLPAAAQCGVEWQPGPPSQGPNNGVRALLRLPNGDLVAGGLFTLADAETARHVARWDGSTWHALGTGLDDHMYALALLPNGDLLAGGRFQTAGGLPASRLARWDGASWSQFAGGCDGIVLTIAVQPNGDVVVGGVFATAGGTPAASIARWDGSTWHAFGTGLTGTSSLPGTVTAVARLNNGDLVAAGGFSVGALSSLALARWDGTSWSPLANATGGNVTGVARALVLLPNGDLLVGGAMNGTPSVPANAVLRWDGTSAHVIVSPVFSPFALAISASGEVVAGGYSIPNVPTTGPGVATWNGTTWTPLPGLQPSVVQAIVHDAADRIVVGLTPFSVNTPPFVRRWNGVAWTDLSAPTPPIVKATLRAGDGSVFVGGEFTSFGGVAANNIVRWQGGVWSPLGAGLDGRVKSLTLAPNGDLIVSGNFTTAGGAPANRIARWNGFAWSTVGANLVAGADLLAATILGEVFAAPGWTLSRFDGTQWTELTLPFAGSVNALAALPGGDLLIGGAFGVSLQHIGIFRYQAGTFTPVPGTPLTVADMVVTADGTLAVAGAMGGHVAMTWDGTTWTTIGMFNTSPSTALRWVTTLPDGGLLFGGTFTSVNGVAVQDFARWDGTAWHAFDHAALNGVTEFAAMSGDGTLFVAGGFTTAGSHVAWGFTTGEAVCPASAAAFGAGCAGGAGPLALQAGNLPWAGGTFTSTATGFTSQSLGLHAIGTQPIVLPLPGGSPGCTLFVSPVLTDLLMPAAGQATASLTIPGSVSLAGLTLRTQVVGLELDATLGLVRITSTNALDLTVGAF